MSAHSHTAHHIIQPSTYRRILFVLMFFMVATIVAAKWKALEFGIVWNLVIALSIAFCKVYYIMAYFMHVKFSSIYVKLLSVLGFLFVAILFVLTFNDYVGRDRWHDRFVPAPANAVVTRLGAPPQTGEAHSVGGGHSAGEAHH